MNVKNINLVQTELPSKAKRIVQLNNKSLGYVFRHIPYVNGKDVIYLIDSTHRPLVDDKGNLKTILVAPKDYLVLGFED